MALVTTAEIIDTARAAGQGVGAFNVITLEHAEAIADGAREAQQPAILQISENAIRFHGGRLRPLTAAVATLAQESRASLAVHLDHIQDESLLHQAAGTGISSVMYDGSTLEYRENVATTREAASWGAEHDIWIEAELGKIGGKDGAHAPGVRTDPAEAVEFVRATGVNALAVAVGSSHAMLDRTATLDLDLIGRLAAALPVPLVLHGSSGVPDETLAAAVRAGMVKINVGTALNIAFTGAVRQTLGHDESIVDPRKYLLPGREAMAAEVARLLSIIGMAAR
ncbi:class II fructose-bisphosphate aldolase [Demetria terragena]|uniref:class II fructose-bisphosphate aldolase n=1 Tax=Demetria terragena TaxID=63959 RepID=UPI00036A9139|nr:class II fructose-bisphosphate aldolase [Demetria terragena]